VTNATCKTTIRFTDTEIIYYLEGDVYASQKYHLSDKNCIDASYDPAKVGLISKGNYIFKESGDCSYIKFANPSEFKMGSTQSQTGLNVWITVFAQP